MGQVFSGGSSHPVTAEQLQSVQHMQRELMRLPALTLQDRDNPREYQYFAFFNGTGRELHNRRRCSLTDGITSHLHV